MAGMSRTQVEQASRPLLVRLHALPRPVVPILTLVLVGVGALAPTPVALAALAIVFCFVAWIAYLSWPAVPASGRALRVIMLALIVGVGLTHLA